MPISSVAPARALSLQFKLLGALSLGLAVVVLCALAGLGSAWLNLSTTIPPEVARNAQAEGLQREFRMQVQEWKNVLLRGSDEALRTKHLAAFDAQGGKTGDLAKGLAAVCLPSASSVVPSARSLPRTSASPSSGL